VTALHVTLLVAGHSSQRERLARRGGSWRSVPFPATVALIEHPTGTVLYDTGYAHRYVDATRPMPERLYSWLIPGVISPGESAVEQLAARGIDASAVSTIVLSHLHADHSSGVLDFPAARIVAAEGPDGTPGQRARGSLWSTTAHGVLPAMLPEDYAQRRVDPATLPSVETGLLGMGEGYDVMGDGSIVAVPLPGHSPGHLGLWLPATQGPRVLLVGDACWLRAALTGDLPPQQVIATMHDPDAYVRTITALTRLAAARPDILIVPSHCQETVDAARAVLGG
jgi:glyoxylase-like metal-dependent hydrolase (beta-lactamase superfamily II)